MPLDPAIDAVTARIIERSAETRSLYLDRMRKAVSDGPTRAHLSCGNQAHAYAGAGQDQSGLATTRAPNIGIITAYNDMLSAHQPFEADLAARSLAGYKRPRLYIYLDAMPRGANGKLDRRALARKLKDRS